MFTCGDPTRGLAVGHVVAAAAPTVLGARLPAGCRWFPTRLGLAVGHVVAVVPPTVFEAEVPHTQGTVNYPRRLPADTGDFSKNLRRTGVVQGPL